MNDDNVKKLLDDVGPGFCLAKWTQVGINLSMGETQSCHHNRYHTIPISEIKKSPSALHNTEDKKRQRKQMLSGERPNECNYCWTVEDNSNFYSDRVTMSAKYNALDYYEQIKNSNGDENFNPKQLELVFSNACNFACAYCGPTFSSKWTSDIDRNGPYVNDYNKIYKRPIPEREYNPYIEAFWQYLPEFYSNLHTLRITGGEPLMSPHTHKILNFIKNNPNKNLSLIINTNLGVPDELFNEFLSDIKDIEPHVKQVEIATSGESTGKRAEYIRDGLDYTLWYNRCETILSTLNVNLNLMCAYNLLSITTFTDFLKDIKKLYDKYGKIKLSVTNVTHPRFLSITLAPDDWKKYILESLKFLEDNVPGETVNRFKHVLGHFESKNNSDLEELKEFIRQYDLRRGKNFKETFPEYSFIQL